MATTFPYTLLRIAGGSIDDLLELNFDKSESDTLKTLSQLQTVQESTIKQLCEIIYLNIGSNISKAHRTKLLNIKRGLLARQPLDGKDCNLLEEILDERAKGLVDSYKNSIFQEKVLTNLFITSYNDQLANKKIILDKLIKTDVFQRGLLLSSFSFHHQMSSHVYYNLEISNIEVTCAKYLSRIHAKTSPFSSFTNIGCGHLVNDEMIGELEPWIKDLHIDYSTNGKVSTVRLNIRILDYILHLIKFNDTILQYVVVKINPTIKDEGDVFSFLVNFNNKEGFQKLKKSVFLTILMTYLQQEKENTFNELEDAILELENATRSEVNQYLKSLIEIGFIFFYIPISSTDPRWEDSLLSWLNKISGNVHSVKKINDCLKAIKNNLQLYPTVNTSLIGELLYDTYLHVYEICNLLYLGHRDNPNHHLLKYDRNGLLSNHPSSEPYLETNTKAVNSVPVEASEAITELRDKFNPLDPRIKPEYILYEDVTVNGTFYLNKNKIEQIVEKMNTFAKTLMHYDYQINSKNKMSLFFLNKYGENEAVNVLTFYHDFKKENNKNNEIELNDKLAKLVLRLSAFDKDNHVLNIDLKKIKKAQNELAPNLLGNIHTTNSLSAFLQFETTASGEILSTVCNGIYPGYGKFYSRFLDIIDDQVLNELRKYNSSVKHDSINIENRDRSFFNANMHPQIFPFSIWLPGVQNGTTAEIPITDIVIKYNSQTKSLCLFKESSNQKVFLFDFGFESHFNRSELFMLLNILCGEANVLISNFSYEINKLLNLQNESSIELPKIHPRIVLDNEIVIQRKMWHFVKEQLPHLKPHIDDSECFRQVYNWRIQYKLPEEVFVKKIYNANSLNKEHVYAEKQEDRKPQYINFNNPFLVKLLTKLITTPHIILCVEEVLPSTNNQSLVDKKKHITEHVIQWYNV